MEISTFCINCLLCKHRHVAIEVIPLTKFKTTVKRQSSYVFNEHKS